MASQLINHPGWFNPYGEQLGIYDADGWVFWSCIGNGPDGFVVYVFRSKDGATEKVPYSPFLHHGLLTLQPRGLVLFGFAQWSSKEPKRFYAIDIQGFKPWAREDIASLPLTIATPVNGVDDVARGLVVDARKVADGANTKVNALTKQVNDHLTKHPSSAPAAASTPGLSKADVEAIAWSKANDALYAAVVNSDEHGYFAQGVRKYAPKSTGTGTTTPVDEEALMKKVLDKVRAAKIVIE